MDAVVLLFAVVPLLIASSSADVCFWSGSCINRWVGGCGSGRVRVDQSDDCHGLCAQPQYPACHPFYTHILCCNEETPMASDECAQCENRVDIGKHWMCCNDCSEVKVTNPETKTGFCRSGGQLSIQQKAQEVFKWMYLDWSECSANCGGGVRHRTARCVGSLEYSPQQLYYVNDTRCDGLKKPLKEEPCGNRPCLNGGPHLHHKMKRHHRHRRGLPIWARLMIFGVTSATVAGLAFGAYGFYQRRKEGWANHGCVYVMLDNYS